VIKDMWILVSGFQISDKFKTMEDQSDWGNEAKDEETEGEETGVEEEWMLGRSFQEVDSVERKGGSSSTVSFRAGLPLGNCNIVSRWVDRKISNYDYLMALNHLAGR
jgi:hypothetical protein